MDRLPDEILVHISKFLDVSSLLALICTDRRLRLVISSDEVWKRVAYNLLGQTIRLPSREDRLDIKTLCRNYMIMRGLVAHPNVGHINRLELLKLEIIRFTESEYNRQQNNSNNSNATLRFQDPLFAIGSYFGNKIILYNSRRKNRRYHAEALRLQRKIADSESKYSPNIAHYIQ